jgi:MFS family permease
MTEAARRYGFGALSHRNFRLFFIGQGISLIGTWMQNVGEGWLILTLTNSPFFVGLTAALSSIGVLLFSLYAGVIADRTDKRRVIVFMQLAFMLEAFTVAILVWTSLHGYAMLRAVRPHMPWPDPDVFLHRLLVASA